MTSPKPTDMSAEISREKLRAMKLLQAEGCCLPKPTSIVVLDDDPTFIKTLVKFSRRRNVDICTCETFGELVQKLKTDRPDVLIVDYNLEENLKGTDVAHLTNNIPILLVSGKSQWTVHHQKLHSSIKDFLHKKYGATKVIDEALHIAKNTSHR